jgi:hypothetical protein
MAKKTAPVGFSEDIAARICGLISEGLSLRKIEMKEGMPTKSAVLSWLLQGEAYKANGEPTHPKAPFLDQYARAREVQADCLADDIISIADDSQYDLTTDDSGSLLTRLRLEFWA